MSRQMHDVCVGSCGTAIARTPSVAPPVSRSPRSPRLLHRNEDGEIHRHPWPSLPKLFSREYHRLQDFLSMVCLPAAIRWNARHVRVPGLSEVVEVLHLAVPAWIIVAANKILKQAFGGAAVMFPSARPLKVFCAFSLQQNGSSLVLHPKST